MADSKSPTVGYAQGIVKMMRLLTLGFTGGFIATGVMTAFRMPISRSLPPTENLWAQYIGGSDLEEYQLPAVILHLFYGAIAGSVFASVLPWLNKWSPLGTETTGLAGGILFSIPFAWLGEAIFLNRLLGMDLDANESMVFHASHLVYGITLGAWVGSRYETLSDGK